MKTVVLLFLSSVLLFSFGCSDNSDSLQDVSESDVIYPISIETTDFSLNGWDCWQNLGFNIIHLINSEQELRHYFTCKILVDIDFVNYSLLVFNVEHCNIDSKVEKISLQQLSEDKYLLSVDVMPSLTANAAPLIVSILVPKIAEATLIELIVSKNSINNGILEMGTWREVYPCKDCSILTFTDNDTIYQKYIGIDFIYKMHYRFINEDTIQIVRTWETNPELQTTNNKLYFSGDSLIIEKFYRSDAAVYPPEYIAIKLVKTE